MDSVFGSDLPASSLRPARPSRAKKSRAKLDVGLRVFGLAHHFGKPKPGIWALTFVWYLRYVNLDAKRSLSVRRGMTTASGCIT